MRRYVRATCVLCKFGSPVITEWKLMSSSGTNGPGKCRKKKKNRAERKGTGDEEKITARSVLRLTRTSTYTTHLYAQNVHANRRSEENECFTRVALEGAVNFNSLTKQPNMFFGSKHAYFRQPDFRFRNYSDIYLFLHNVWPGNFTRKMKHLYWGYYILMKSILCLNN